MLIFFHFAICCEKCHEVSLCHLEFVNIGKWRMKRNSSQSVFCLLYCLVGIHVQVSQAFYPKEVVLNDNKILRKWQVASSYFDSIAWFERDFIEHSLDKFFSSLDSESHPSSSQSKHERQPGNISLPSLRHEKELEKEPSDGDGASVSQPCLKSLHVIDASLKSRKFWTYQMIDSWSRGEAAVNYGQVSDLGKRGSCIDLKVQESNDSFSGKYCLVKVNFPFPSEPLPDQLAQVRFNVSGTNLSSTIYEYYANYTSFFYRDSFSFAICAPSTCSNQDINQILHVVSRGTELDVSLRKYCETSEERKDVKNPPITTIMSLVLGSFLAFVLVCSFACDFMDHWKFKLRHEPWMRHFHVATNTRKLLMDYQNPAYQRMRLFDTNKCVFQIFAICVHTLITGSIFPTVFPAFREYRSLAQLPSWINELLLRFTYGTQVLVCLSGFFTCYIVYPILEKAKGNVPFYLYALKRWLRTAPTVAAVIALTFVMPLFTTHPVAREAFDIATSSCASNWWQTIFLVNNYNIPIKDICVIQTWFISVDFQLWLIAYFPLLLLYKRPKIGVIVCLCLMVMGCISSSLIVYFEDLPAYPTGREVDIFLFMVYSKRFIPWHFYVNSGVCNYFLGILTAYYCLTQKPIKSQFSLRWLGIGAAWITTQAVIILFPTFWREVLQWPSNRTVEVIYAGLVRVPFGVFLVVPLMAVYYGFASKYPFTEYCNNRFWVVMGRLAFSVYLSHLLTLVYVGSSLFERIPGTVSGLGCFFSVYVVVSFFVGYLIHVLFEAPMANLLAELVKRKLSHPQLVSQRDVVEEVNNNDEQKKQKKKRRIANDISRV